MKTIYQDQPNNCLSACLASILELDIKEVPNFYTYNPRVFWDNIDSWLDKKDLMTTQWSDKGLKEIQKNHKRSGYGIIVMKHKDSDTRHAFVSLNGLPIHDPWYMTNHINKFDEESALHFSLIKKFKGK